MQVTMTRFTDYFKIGIGESNIIIRYNDGKFGYDFISDTNFDKNFHNKLVSFFSNLDVIEAFPLYMIMESRDITAILFTSPSKKHINGRFVGNGAVYFNNGTAYKLNIRRNKRFYNKSRKVSMDKLNGTVVTLPETRSKVIVTKDEEIYLKIQECIKDNKTILFLHNDKEYHVVVIVKEGAHNYVYAIMVKDFGKLTFTPEQLISRVGEFKVTEIVTTTKPLMSI